MNIIICFRLIRQRSVFKSRGPLKIWDFSESQNVTEACFKVTLYPLSHKCPTESKEWLAIPGRICALDAAAFNSVMSNSEVLEDSIVAPLGRRTIKGVRDLTLFKHGAFTKRKWPLHPDSTIADSCCLRRGEVRQTSNVELLFKLFAPEHHSLLV
jgi:hypothetical protein